MTAGGTARIESGFVSDRFMLRVFAGVVALAMVAAVISIGGKYLGRSIAMAGHTESERIHEIVIGNNVLTVPANMIRFEKERRDGVASSLHLYALWPTMQGYRYETRDEFNHSDGSRNILFVTFNQRSIALDMSGRLDPIYRSLIEPLPTRRQGSVAMHRFNASSGYQNEMLALAELPGGGRFVARCLSGPTADETLAGCERDVHMGEDLTLTYRFHQRLLPDYVGMDAAVKAFARDALKTD